MSSRPQTPEKWPLWWDRFFALLILVNYVLVIFNLTYIPLRDFWLQGRVQITLKIGPFKQEFPDPPLRILPFSVATYYDWVKDIEPHRTTVEYLDLVSQLQTQWQQNGGQVSPASQQLLGKLRQASREMIVENPFQIANKTGTLERIKNKMREHVFGTTKASATQAFETFWTAEYLLNNDPQKQFSFFDQYISPLLATNYFRAIAENGQPLDNFPLLDFPFFVIFLAYFLVQTRWLKTRHPGLSWLEAMLWRWYDVFLLLPVLRWLRIIPLILHLSEARLLDLTPFRHQIVRGLVGIIAGEMTQVIIVRLMTQIQSLIQSGQVRQILNIASTKSYVDLNDRNEIAEIIKILSQIVVERVLPFLEPEIERFLAYNLRQTIQQLPSYQKLVLIPGLGDFQDQIVRDIFQKSYGQFLQVLQMLIQSDPQFEVLIKDLVDSFRQRLSQELQAQNDLSNIEQLLVDLVEELKINYVQKLSDTDMETILEQTRLLRQGQV